MQFNPLSNFKVERWYHVIIVLSAIVFGLSLTVDIKGVENNIVQLLSLGIFFIGMGEWINHPLQTRIDGQYKITGFHRNASTTGVLFDLLGFVLCVIGFLKVV